MRVVARRPGARTRVDIRLNGDVLRVSTSNARGGVDIADIEIMVPRAMNLTLGRGDVDITVVGSEGQIAAENMRGKIDIDGGREGVVARSQFGSIRVRNTRGSVLAHSSHENVEVIQVAGDINAESNSKHITLTNVDSRNVRVSTIGGTIRFSGPLHEDGRYEFLAHAGSIFIHTTPPVHATVSVATVTGGFGSDFEYQVTERRRAGIFTAQIGKGGAQVQAESFSGGIMLKKQ